jgi:phosphoenolpyruvate carboxykinase (GTP)
MDDRSRRRQGTRRRNTHGELKLDGLNLPRETLAELLHIDSAGWQTELHAIGEYLDSFGPRLPAALRQEQQRVAQALDTPRKAANA